MLYTGELTNQMLKAGNPKLLVFILKDKLLIIKVKLDLAVFLAPNYALCSV